MAFWPLKENVTVRPLVCPVAVSFQVVSTCQAWQRQLIVTRPELSAVPGRRSPIPSATKVTVSPGEALNTDPNGRRWSSHANGFSEKLTPRLFGLAAAVVVVLVVVVVAAALPENSTEAVRPLFAPVAVSAHAREASLGSQRQ